MHGYEKPQQGSDFHKMLSLCISFLYYHYIIGISM